MTFADVYRPYYFIALTRVGREGMRYYAKLPPDRRDDDEDEDISTTDEDDAELFGTVEEAREAAYRINAKWQCCYISIKLHRVCRLCESEEFEVEHVLCTNRLPPWSPTTVYGTTTEGDLAYT